MSPDHPLLVDDPGHSELLLGNEAIVRGAIEAGVGFACGYPGTPSTEVTDGFARLAPLLGIPFEYSVNEKVALEMAFAASLAGTRSIVAMKHLGLMYAGDPLSTIPYVGTVGGLVIVSAGDPSMHTSPNETDQRHLAEALHIPMLDPRTPQEALDATRFAFELSERSRLPVILRPTTRVCHTSAPVRFGPLTTRSSPAFVRDPRRFLPTPGNARRMREEIADRLTTARSMIGASGLVEHRGRGRRGVLASGAPAAIVADLLESSGEDGVTLLSTGAVFPLPDTWPVDALRELEVVLVVEELSPYLEDRVRSLCNLHGLSTRVLGKRTGQLPDHFEYTPQIIASALHSALGLPLTPPVVNPTRSLPRRPPTLCAGCPHRSTFFSARSVFGDDALYFNDIGCYTLGAAPPLGAGDALLSMGAGFSLAAGVSRTTGQRTLGFLGDSTFFHSGMPALLNAIKENVDMVAVIMDNEVTAMTGFQESPGMQIDAGRLSRSVDMEAVVRALGATHVETIDPEDLASAMAAFERARENDGLSVVISRRACPVYSDRAGMAVDSHAPEGREILTYAIDHELCGYCGRSDCGQRCHQGVAEGFERVMVRARSLEVGHETRREPVAPCATSCPLFLCIQGYAAHIAAGRYADALELITDGLPLPDSVCRVCHRPCEAACVLTDQPVAVNDLKRFVMDWAARQDPSPHVPVTEPANGLRVAVVGAGPAGLAGAHDLAMRGYAVTLFDAAHSPGGILAHGIPAYRLPPAALQRDIDRILAMGVEFRGGLCLGEDLRIDDLVEQFDALLLALGGGPEPVLDLEGDGPPVISGLAYLGVGDGGDLMGVPPARRVVVIGGGNSAVDAARTALRRGAEQVTIACLESRTAMPAIGTEISAAEEEGVVIRPSVRATGLIPSGVTLTAVAARVPEPTGPEDYADRAGDTSTVEADLVVTAIGQRPDLGFLLGSTGRLTVTSPSGPMADERTGRTSNRSVFVAGDMADSGGSVTAAIAGGLRAGWGIDRQLRGPEIADRRPPPPIVDPQPPDRHRGARRVDSGTRLSAPEVDPLRRRTNFEEVVGVLTEEEARAEAARCLVCGLCGNCNSCLDLFGCPAFRLEGNLIEIDPLLCVGCGVCAQFCPNGAIHPVFAESGPAQTAPAETLPAEAGTAPR
ncbi:MAG TPA: hypothetical protein ENI86_18225 [Acidimicrobiales bacterium]|nr:hypothetical protein [Acidimicrobiales bacterium]